MKKLLFLISVITLAGCAKELPKRMTQQECEDAGGLMYGGNWGDCYTDKESYDYKQALERKQKKEAKCISSLDYWSFVAYKDLSDSSKDAVVMTSDFKTWIIENAGRGYAHGRTYGLSNEPDYCYVNTGYVDNRHNYPIVKKVKWKKV